MIDWVTCKIPFVHPFIASGAIIFLDHDGQVTKERQTRRSVPGSHHSSFTVQSGGSAGEGLAAYLSLSGNPSKFLQGHNVFGSDNLVALMVDTVRQIDSFFSLGIDPFTYRAIKKGEFDVSTVDINYSFHLPSQSDVQTWIRNADVITRSRAGRPVLTGGTVYWQKHSRRWALKAYSKLKELQCSGDHALPDALKNSQLLPWVENVLRIELRLKSLELKELGLVRAKDLMPNVRQLFHDYLGKIVMPTQLQLMDKALAALPIKLFACYTLWRAGHNVVELYSRPTFYRYRKQLLEHGIDISIAMLPEASNVIPMVRVLEAKPASIPDWAFSDGLVHKTAVNY